YLRRCVIAQRVLRKAKPLAECPEQCDCRRYRHRGRPWLAACAQATRQQHQNRDQGPLDAWLASQPATLTPFARTQPATDRIGSIPHTMPRDTAAEALSYLQCRCRDEAPLGTCPHSPTPTQTPDQPVT